MRSHGLWEVSAPPPPPTRMLLGDEYADVIIVGAGFTGCSAALHLAAAGRSPVVLDAAEIGYGGSGRNVGLVNAGMWVMPSILLQRLGEKHGERLLDQLGRAPDLVFDIIARYKIACEAVRSGTLHCAVGSKGQSEIIERHRQWHARGAPVELLEGSEATRRIGSSAYSGALLDRRAGTIQPLAYVRGIAEQAIKLGARIYTGSPVIGWEDTGGGTWRVATPAGNVKAPWVILATDAYSGGACSGLKREQVMLPYFNLATRPLPDEIRASILPERQGAWDTNTVLSSFRLDALGRLVFGSVGKLRGPRARVHTEWGKRQIARIFPQLVGEDFEYSWYGMIGMTNDAAPRFHIHARNIVSIGGYSGRGIAPATTFGRDLAQLVLGQTDVSSLALPLTGESPAHLRALQSAAYDAGSLLVHFTGSRSFS